MRTSQQRVVVRVSRALVVALALTVAIDWLPVTSARAADQTLLNVSYDPTRELWKDVNAAFGALYAEKHGQALKFEQSHGGSSSQARAVIDGLGADVVTLALWTDTEAIRKAGLIDAGWENEFPNRSLPYVSTIVFVVRKGNPKNIHDWPDLVAPGIEIVTPNPKTSGNGKLSFLAAWGAVLRRGGSEDDARAFVSKLYRQAPVLDTGARGSTTTFAQKGIGDVHLTWENEAFLEVEESGGKLEIVYPPVSILAEPHVAVVDRNVDRHGTRKAAEEYLAFLYTPAGQAIIAKHHYRPTNADAAATYASQFASIDLFSITAVVPSWQAANDLFFADGKVYDQIYAAGR